MDLGDGMVGDVCDACCEGDEEGEEEEGDISDDILFC